jgi:hypothetical protein
MSTLSIKSRNTKSAAPKKGSAQSKTASKPEQARTICGYGDNPRARDRSAGAAPLS